MTMLKRESGVEIGLEQCRRDPPPELSGRIGLIANQSSVDRDFRFAGDVLAELPNCRLAALFSPQHGLWGCEQANMIESEHAVHPRLGVPVYSLYSETRMPTPEMLADLDCFVVDLADVGTRVYTFIWTVSYCLEACAEANLPMVILDRPNPLGGEIVEGPLLQSEYASFVGRTPIPMRHALTIGEIALLLNQQLNLGAEVYVVPLGGWRREMLFPQTQRRWLAPSPNMPRFETALVYPGQVLLEGTNLSEGRGTTAPFEVCGAPFIDPDRWLSAIERFALPGVRFLPTWFQPTFDKWSGQTCGGLSLHVTDADAFRPLRTTLALLAAAHQLWPNQLAWLPPPYEYENEKPPIDILTGSEEVRTAIDADSLQSDADLDRHCITQTLWPLPEFRLYA